MSNPHPTTQQGIYDLLEIPRPPPLTIVPSMERLVLRKISELVKDGLWPTKKQLQKQREPSLTPKVHWDFLLEEMKWMAGAFAKERKWKLQVAKMLVRSAKKCNQTKQLQIVKEEKGKLSTKIKTAGEIAKKIRQFWSNIKTVVEYREKCIVETIKKKALAQKLRLLVDETEKFTETVSKNMTATLPDAAAPEEEADDAEFIPPSDYESDEEDTIAEEEAIALQDKHDDNNDTKTELDELEAENKMTQEEILLKYANYLQNVSCPINKQSGRSGRRERSKRNVSIAADSKTTRTTNGTSFSIVSKNCLFTEEDDDEENSSEDKEESNSDYYYYGGNENDGGGLPDLLKSIVSDEDTSLNTVSSTNDKVKVPYILRHPLREYQHAGLNWLVTMYDKNLNGILADEMGLGKTIQTIALLAFLAVERFNWGPHLIIVPTSVLLNWEMEFKKWCPSLKIVTYYGGKKERKLKFRGWKKPNSFHVCITSYNLAVQDFRSFRNKHWQYLILDEAHNIKNFKSQRWQLLLNLCTQKRLLLTGTPLQNNLMEMWSLLHFLMPTLFQSHSEFKEWFSKPMQGMVEGSKEYNENVIRRLHKVLRPFILRRLKCEVEKQLPHKFEHVVMCQLSKRQRFLYEEFMSLTRTKEALLTGGVLSVMSALMQLRKVCNHPNLLEPRPILSPFYSEGIKFTLPACIWHVLDDADENSCNRNYSLFTISNPNLSFTEEDAVYISELTIPMFIFDPNVNRRYTKLSFYGEPFESVIAGVSGWERDVPIVNLAAETCTLLPSLPASLRRYIVFQEEEEDIEMTEEGPVVFCNNGEIGNDNPSSSSSRFLEMLGYSEVEFELDYIQERKLQDRKQVVTSLSKTNKSRCRNLHTIYNSELIDACTIVGKMSSMLIKTAGHCQRQAAACLGYVNGFSLGYIAITILNNVRQTCPNRLIHPALVWTISKWLYSLIPTVQDRANQMASLLERFVVYIPSVSAPSSLESRIYRPLSAKLLLNWRKERVEYKERFWESMEILHPITRGMQTSFPDPRLIQFDCGKLQTLDPLLRRLKQGGHRVLIFTQMGRMLDILESFLTYHGYIYLRLDGQTKIERRQMLMERFNADRKVFCFILSTRSGGVGINLTGADTVIFYDSDWNPTMDAQAQDRCHRIGQTRDVHIYRLISEQTVEENILRKSNEKRLLGELALEGGNFTTGVLKQRTIRDIFNVNDDDRTKEGGQINKVLIDEENINLLRQKSADSVFAKSNRRKMLMLENALAEVEDDADVRAGRRVREEVDAETAEFCGDDGEYCNTVVERIDREFQQIYDLLNDVERYAINLMQTTIEEWSNSETLSMARSSLENN